MAKSDIGNVDRLCLLVRDVMDNEVGKTQPRTVNSEPDIKIMAKGQIQGMRILAKAIIVELQRGD